MEEYLGSFPLSEADEEFEEYKNFKKIDWVLYFVERFGQYDGGHHKQWVLDQISRIIHGTKVIVEIAKWQDGTRNIRVHLDEPSQKYLDWVIAMKDGEDGEDTYDYDEGIAP